MRIAVLLCGEPRYSAASAQGIINNICDPLRRQGHAVDLLGLFWTTRIMPGVIPPRSSKASAHDTTPRWHNYDEHTAIERVMKPVALSFLQKPSIDVSWMQEHCRKDVTTYGMYCQFLSWYLGKQLLEQAELVHGAYDLVLRSRLDVVPREQFILPEQAAEEICIPNIEGHTPVPFDGRVHCNDQLAVGPRSLMGRYLELHCNYAVILEGMKHFEIPEWMLHWYLTTHLGCGYRRFSFSYEFKR